MIPKTIHQVFWNFKGKEIEEIPAYKSSIEKTKKFCQDYNYEYNMWGLKQCEELLCDKYPQYIELWKEFRYSIQQCDFIRYLILHDKGGWYVDCDAYPLQDLKPLSNCSEVFSQFHDDKKKIPCNAQMGSVPNNSLWMTICDDIEKRVIEKQNMKIYDTWKGRLIFQTTGHRMLKANVPDTSIYDLLIVHNDAKNISTKSLNPYFYEGCVSIWYDF
tara:strand:- start:42 stop:689 length:648 start_codon:yes stop_codon:yes gene_type:complete